MNYYYSKEKILSGIIPYSSVKGKLYKSRRECLEKAGVDKQNRTGYIYKLKQMENTGENINHRYKSGLPFVVIECISVMDFYS